MLFLHAVLLLVLGTFAVAIPISRRAELIGKNRIVGYWRTPVSENGSLLFSKAHTKWQCIRNDPTITNTRAENEAAPTNVMYINEDGFVQVYRDEREFMPGSNFLYGTTRWKRAEKELVMVSRPSRPNILTSYV